MAETSPVRVRVLRGFRLAIGQDAVEGQVIDLPRDLFQLMLGANAVAEVPADAPISAIESEKPAPKGGDSKSKEKQS